MSELVGAVTLLLKDGLHDTFPDLSVKVGPPVEPYPAQVLIRPVEGRSWLDPGVRGQGQCTLHARRILTENGYPNRKHEPAAEDAGALSILVGEPHDLAHYSRNNRPGTRFCVRCGLWETSAGSLAQLCNPDRDPLDLGVPDWRSLGGGP